MVRVALVFDLDAHCDGNYANALRNIQLDKIWARSAFVTYNLSALTRARGLKRSLSATSTRENTGKSTAVRQKCGRIWYLPGHPWWQFVD